MSEEGSDPEFKSGPTVITPIPILKPGPMLVSDSTISPANLQDITIASSSRSKGSYYIGPLGPPITIDKNTKGLREKYYKNDNITIRLRILNCDLKNTIEYVNLQEEIPNQFELVKKDSDTYEDDSEKNPNRDPKTIRWVFNDGIYSSINLEYTVRTNKSGQFIFNSPLLRANIKDNNGRSHEISQSNNDNLYIAIHNREPSFERLEYPEAIKLGKDATINVVVKDFDSDPINVYIYKKDHTLVGTFLSKNNGQDNSSHTYILNQSELNNKGVNEFTLVATDHESKTQQSIEIEVYNIIKRKYIPTIDTQWIIFLSFASGIPSLLIGIAIGYRHYKRIKKYIKIYLATNEPKYRRRKR
ncbi:hypothetical protein P0O24_00455 [Methanotrichaceae archaeon M04Ac]|uniref:Cadherin domain-containing protein n=1 Tax=Candidatus Methanocrinis alkalitolerans TaxID=3033395 RepID=A0ABT5XBG6_9EURY|nr:hypothetical protein [Candidatus Methanocrinis alkalitolerans]MDF0592059.1 hypothetical protein [Candidatus Methanocrinis alkalitolerans]